MSSEPTTEVTNPPAIPAKARSIVYLTALAVSAAVFLVNGLTDIYLPSKADEISDLCGVITSVVSLIAAGLGVAYRPTTAPPPHGHIR